jgi:predicted nucleic acid-binding protein
VIVIADAGPLIALAKINGLGALLQLYSPILTTPAVYDEAVTRGLALGAEDAPRLEAEYERGMFEVRAPSLSSLPVPALLGLGEEESILLAIELRADWLLVDDLEARRAAQNNFVAAGVSTAIQGTLGIIVSAYRKEHIFRAQAIEMVETIKNRPDIWVSAELCERVINSLQRTL